MNTFTLPEGFTIRAANLDDADIVADLCKLYGQTTAGVDDVTAEELRSLWQSPGLNLDTDTRLVFSASNQLVAEVETWANNPVPVHPFVWVCVHPGFMGRGLGTYLTRWAEERCRKLMDVLPNDVRLAPRGNTHSTNQAARQLLENAGWRDTRSYYTMRIDMVDKPPAPVWPAGLEMRQYTPDDLRAVYSAHRDAFQDHFGYVEVPFEEGLERYKHNIENDALFDPTLYFLAWKGDSLAGYCLCRSASFSNHDAGYVNILGVRRAWRKHGLGLAFLQHAFGEFYKRGQMRVELGVDAQNLTSAMRLYEKAGMHVHHQVDMFEKELRPGREISTQELSETP